MAVPPLHQRVRAGLDLVGPRVDVVCARAAGRDQLAADVGVRGQQQLHRIGCGALADGAVLHANDVALVTHDTAHVESLRSGELGESAGVLGWASAAREADVDVDDDFTNSTADSS